MQIMFGTILWVLLNGLILTKATITPKDYTNSNILQEENVSMYPELNFTQNISMPEKSDHHILNFKSDQSHSDNTGRNERKVDEVTLANISIIPEFIESSLSKPTSLRAFVQFDSPFIEKVNDIFVTLRWNQPEFTDEIIQGYTVHCFFIEDILKEIQICDDKNITITKLEHTVHNLTFNTIYYFRVRAHTKIVAGPYTDLINVSTAHENPIPKLLITSRKGIRLLDVDLNITNFELSESVENVVYLIQEDRIYWGDREDLMTLKINENNVTKIATFFVSIHYLCIDWVARNLYFTSYLSYDDIIKFDLAMWENGIIKSEEISKAKNLIDYLNVSPSMGILYYTSKIAFIQRRQMKITKTHFDGKIEQIVVNSSICPLEFGIHSIDDMIIDNMNKEPLIYCIYKVIYLFTYCLYLRFEKEICKP